MRVSKVNLNTHEEIDYIEDELAAINAFHSQQKDLSKMKKVLQRNNIKQDMEQIQQINEFNCAP